jgi:hypothetical protein
VWAFCVWHLVRGVWDPFILAILWFLVAFIGVFGLFFSWLYLQESAAMKALNAHLTAHS